jgi:LysM repeat protein
MLAAAWGTWLNSTSAQAASSRFAPVLPPPPTDLATEPVSLPSFHAAADEAGITRQANLTTESPHRSRVEVVRYTVQPNDSIFGIAKKFDLKPETVLWGNYEVLEDNPHLLRPGQELNILPLDGVYYQWQAGDTVEGVAESLGVGVRDILDWPGNNLGPINASVDPGRWLVIPGGKRAMRQWVVPTIARGRAGVGTALGPGGCSGDYSGGAIGGGGFIWPASNHYVSGNDYWSGHLAIDIAAGEGAPVWASDTGVVVFAGWSTTGYGNMVMVDHGNGWQTLYAHLSQVDVGCGSNVGQGGKIGLAGSTGNSTGPHLHFEIRFEGGFVNPWYVLP